MSLIIIVFRRSGLDFSWIFYVTMFVMLLIGVIGGIYALPTIILHCLKAWYFYLFMALVFVANFICATNCLEGWKNWLIGAEVFSLCNIITSFILSQSFYGDSGVIMCILLFIVYYTAFFIMGLVLSGIGSIVSCKTCLVDAICDKFKR